MAKEKLRAWIHEPVTALLGTRAKVAALRVLWRSDAALPYREIVRRSGMAYRSIDLAVGELTSAGLLHELEGGRERRVQLNSGHRLAPAISALMQSEADYFAALRVELRTTAEACRRVGLLGAAIIGPVARREEVLGEPLDIAIFVNEAADASRCRAAFEAAADAIVARFGVQLKLVVYDLRSARTMWRTRTAAAERSVRESELLAGTSLASLLES